MTRDPSGFDITSILDFKPPTFVCPECRGLFDTLRNERTVQGSQESFKVYCPVCNTQFVYAENDTDVTYLGYMRNSGHVIKHDNLFDHARRLAEIVKRSEAQRWPTRRLFFETLSNSRHFVHFASWGISHVFIGAFTLASVRVPVYGFVSDVETSAKNEMIENNADAPRLKAKVVNSREAAFDAPHQKIVVIDGLLAFKGSMNRTNAGSRRADRDLDILDVVTDFRQVTDLNNRYFAPVWKRITNPNTTQHVMHFLPF